ncbi:MAG: alpha,alpha-trehalase TreF [Bacteroidota bacterium]
MRFILVVISVSVLMLSSCLKNKDKDVPFFESEFFKDVQLEEVFPDSKTFADATPKKPIDEIIALYDEQKDNVGFKLRLFVLENFELPSTPGSGFTSDTTVSMEQHIESLWPVLTRKPDEYDPLSGLIPLPNPYIVPGGRFGEIYYWDSYFTMLGLKASGKDDMIKNMVDNFSFLIDSIGFIPNGNRDYFSGRSQPPFYSLMVRLSTENSMELVDYLPRLEKEYAFWMDGTDALLENGEAAARVVRLEEGIILNRYWDNFDSPRPESFKEDYHLAKEYLKDYKLTEENENEESRLYRDLRAGAESGWDYSSRWFGDQKNLITIQTSKILPVDLNCLIYHLEKTIALAHDKAGNLEKRDKFLKKSEDRKAAIQKVFWNEEKGFFYDYDFKKEIHTGVPSLAAAFPLFFKVATPEQANKTANILELEFLHFGGYVTTLNNTGEQWDFPNGWAPLQWIVYKGLLNYELDSLAYDGASRWISLNRKVYKNTGKMVEKYNVVNNGLEAGGGEYILQDGFGWTNGVALKLIEELESQEILELARSN